MVIAAITAGNTVGDQDNTASVCLAEKLGFELVETHGSHWGHFGEATPNRCRHHKRCWRRRGTGGWECPEWQPRWAETFPEAVAVGKRLWDSIVIAEGFP